MSEVDIDIHSTWINLATGEAYAIDHRRSDGWALRRWGDREYKSYPVTEDQLLDGYVMVETMGQAVERRRRFRELQCKRGHHEDPDYSGLCIHCSRATDGDEDPDWVKS